MQPWVAVVIEDDPSIREILEMVLTQNGFQVVLCPDGPSGLEAVATHHPLLTTCDVQMPGMDGFAVAKRIRRLHNTYLMMISAMAEEIDVVQGLEAGADDYLVKPFSPRELRARVDAMLRRLDLGPPGTTPPGGPSVADLPLAGLTTTATTARTATTDGPPVHPGVRGTPLPTYVAPQPSPVPTTSPAAPAGQDWLAHNGLVLHPATRTALLDDRPVALSSSEFDVLATILRTGRRVRSKADLVLALRGQGHVTAYFVDESDKRLVEATLDSARRKLGDVGPHPRFVEDVRGVGYRLAPAR